MSDEIGKMAMVVAAARIVLTCEDDAVAAGRFGLLDCVDNNGQHYQSAHLAGALTILRELLKPTGIAKEDRT